MADSSDTKKLLRRVLDKLTSVEAKLVTFDRELSTIKLDLHDAVMAEKQAAYPIELRLPEYDGTEDPEAWLHRFEIFFSLQQTEDDNKVNLAAFHMTGAAQIWYLGLKRTRGVPTWPQLAESLRRRYNAIVELAQIRRKGSVAKHWGESPLTEKELVAIYINGLRETQLRAELLQRQPATLDEVMQLALELEHKYD